MCYTAGGSVRRAVLDGLLELAVTIMKNLSNVVALLARFVQRFCQTRLCDRRRTGSWDIFE